jgi:hypothetical protein
MSQSQSQSQSQSEWTQRNAMKKKARDHSYGVCYDRSKRESILFLYVHPIDSMSLNTHTLSLGVFVRKFGRISLTLETVESQMEVKRKVL